MRNISYIHLHPAQQKDFSPDAVSNVKSVTSTLILHNSQFFLLSVGIDNFSLNEFKYSIDE